MIVTNPLIAVFGVRGNLKSQSPNRELEAPTVSHGYTGTDIFRAKEDTLVTGRNKSQVTSKLPASYPQVSHKLVQS